MEMHVMVQYVGHVYHAGGVTTYRCVKVELTPEQVDKLKLGYDEFYATISLQQNEKGS